MLVITAGRKGFVRGHLLHSFTFLLLSIGVHEALVYQISHLLQTCAKFCLRVTLCFYSKLSKHVSFREDN
jgi:hypothetical protein